MTTLRPIDLGIGGDGKIIRNASIPTLVAKALERGEYPASSG